jgi:hypothetical protein
MMLVMAKFVDVALVVVELMALSAVIVEEAFATRPAVNWINVEVALPSAVGVNGKSEESEDEETLLLNVVQSAAAKQPKVLALAVLQVTLPFKYVNAPEYVVVAAAYTWPSELTPSPLFVRVERIRVDVKVDDAVESKPFVKPMVVEVALPYPVEVNGNALVIDVASDELETLLLKRFQSVVERYPSAAAPAWVIENAPV